MLILKDKMVFIAVEIISQENFTSLTSQIKNPCNLHELKNIF